MTVGAVSDDLTVLRIARNITVQPNGCWTWDGTKNSDGYGVVGMNGVHQARVHRLMYEAMRGPIAAELQLDHTCHDYSTCGGGSDCPHRTCCNPDHLKPVTGEENTLRGNAPSAINARKTHCLRGHVLAGSNLMAGQGARRKCKTCHRDRARAANTERKSA